MLLVIPRDEVEAGDIAPVAEQLGFLSETAEMALRWEGRIGFVFEGWDADPRETTEIPAIRDYFAKLTEAWPYWLHFAEKVGDTIPHVLRLCCHGRIDQTGQGIVGWRFEDLQEVRQQLLQLFVRQNPLYERHRLPESMNQRISEEVAQLIESVFSDAPEAGGTGH